MNSDFVEISSQWRSEWLANNGLHNDFVKEGTGHWWIPLSKGR